MGSVHAVQGEGSAGKCIAVKPVRKPSNNAQAKPTHQNIIRLAPPLVISEEQIQQALDIIHEAIKELPTLKGEKEKSVIPPGEKNVHIGVDN